MHAERITDVVAYHMEGPCWWPGWDGLRFVDMLAGEILSMSGEGHLSRRKLGRIAAVVRPRAGAGGNGAGGSGAGMVVATERGVTLVDADDTVTPLPDLWDDDSIRMNEGGVAPDGSLYLGQMSYAKTEGAAAMFRMDAERRTTRVLTGLTISNGLDWSPDGTLAYYNDTATGRVDVFDWTAQDGLVNRRPFVALPDAGRPDGLTVDAQGGVWVAVVNRGRVEHYAPDGTLADVVEVPATRVTACTFGGPDLADLFITTSRENLAEGQDPQAGSLFRATPGVRGKLPHAFAG